MWEVDGAPCQQDRECGNDEILAGRKASVVLERCRAHSNYSSSGKIVYKKLIVKNEGRIAHVYKKGTQPIEMGYVPF